MKTLSINVLFFALLFFFSPLFAENNWLAKDIKKINTFSLKQFKPITDPSNKYLFNEKAIILGEQLFSDTRLSSNQKISCATCHIKEKSFTDNNNLAVGLQKGFRNTPTLLNTAHHNWFFADGSKDSLWAQALSSLENPAEQDFTRVEILHLFHQDSNYNKQYFDIFKKNPPLQSHILTLPNKAGPNTNLAGLIAWKKFSRSQKIEINNFFTNIGKSIASYVATIHSKPSRFDQFIEELNTYTTSSLLNSSEVNGYKLFISQKSGCANCHSGPLFSNKEFHNIGTGILAWDNGRSEVIESVIHDEFNCLSKFSDANPNQCVELNYINRDKHRLSGAFKTPSLRNLSKTAPYMHDGRFADLTEVLRHYSSVDANIAKGIDLPPIKLTEQEQQDIKNFLLTL